MKIMRLTFCSLQEFLKRAPAAGKLRLCALLLLASSSSRSQEIKMYSGVNLVLNGNVFFVVNNTAFKNNGSFAAGTSTVKFTGNTDTTIGFVSGTVNSRFYNLTLDKTAYGIAIQSPVGVRNVLTVTSGYLYADSNLTLLSDASNTARLAALPAGSRVIGKAMVERYIPSKRAWRLMTAPVTSASSIYNSWQNKGVYTVGKGLLISAPGGSNGLDNGNSTSLKTWNVSTQSLVSVTNTNVSISPRNNGSADNTGYFVFIRGDRNPSNFVVPNTNTTTLTSIGRLQTDSQTFIASSIGGKFTLIGNPYASPIDFNLVTRTNLVKRFYVWDPTLNALGGYVTLDDLNNDGNYTIIPAGAQTKEIQSSQAFFVETNANGPASLLITESAKSTTNNLNVYRPGATTNTVGTSGSLSANLYLLNNDSSTLLADGTLIEFSPAFDDNITNEDALKFSNIDESLGMIRYGVTMAIERRPLIVETDTLFFRLWKTTKRSYKIRLRPENIYRPNLLAFFEDSYLATSIPLSLVDPTDINFLIDQDSRSSEEARFRIVFKTVIVLPVSFYSLKAYTLNRDIKLDWRVEEQASIIKYDVEKSLDGINFIHANTSIKNPGASYSWLDQHVAPGMNYYRIKSHTSSGQIKYSYTVKVKTEDGISQFAVMPNPVKGNNIHLYFKNKPAGNYQFNLINGAGQVVFSTLAQIGYGSRSKVLDIKKQLPAGIYQLKVTGPSNDIEIQKLIFEE